MSMLDIVRLVLQFAGGIFIILILMAAIPEGWKHAKKWWRGLYTARKVREAVDRERRTICGYIRLEAARKKGGARPDLDNLANEIQEGDHHEELH